MSTPFGGRVQRQSKRILELYEAGWSLRDISGGIGCSHEAVAQTLRRLGVDTNARRMHGARVRREIAEARGRVRAAAREAKTEARYEACLRLLEVAERFGVTASTIAQYTEKTGPYMQPTRPRVDAILPSRWSEEGDRVAALVREATAPYSPRHLALYTMRPSTRDGAAFHAWLREREKPG